MGSHRLRGWSEFPRFHIFQPIELIFGIQGIFNPFRSKMTSVLSSGENLTPSGQVGQIGPKNAL